MSNLEVKEEEVGDSISIRQETVKDQAGPNSLALQIEAALKANLPVIGEINQEKPKGIEVYVPRGGTRWKEISLATGLRTTREMIAGLEAIAAEENLDFGIESDDAEMRYKVRITKKPGINYEKPMDQKNIAVLNYFELNVIPADRNESR